MASGYRTELWTTARIAEVIWKRFRVRYHRDQVGRIMHGLGWSHQKPRKRALERDEAKIRRFIREDWLRL
jgi:transposase